MTAPRWTLEHHRGSAVEFHARELPEPMTRSVWSFEVTRPAIVLGSAQRDPQLHLCRSGDEAVEVARRRSGGGAVWLEPGGQTWVDVIVAADDTLWEQDVSRSMEWLGRVWVGALTQLGVEGAEVHSGPMVTNDWSSSVCFAGLAAGEVTVGGRKLVGISQRRTRAGARFQCALLHRWDPTRLVEVLGVGDRSGEPHAGSGVEVDAARSRVLQAVRPLAVGIDELMERRGAPRLSSADVVLSLMAELELL